ncbi:unnamed protein product [Spirodela intermedia]|uniref:BHLH domain-containing protein n=1 Tax=Spirodela intermedia TaxID=51605 RepID=A0A7I8K1P7_SPIIN|nr:unnamed protein product [Spirodela intermedia]
MGKVTELRQLLRSLCRRAQWKYAVFWKFKGRSHTILAWEDGYCVPSKSTVAWNGYYSGEGGLISFSNGMNEWDGSSAGCSIELAVANMSCHLYSLGQGIVGKVASTRKHRWVVAKSFNSKVTSKYPEELQPQFAAGIKAILFVPIVPFGVVQLGSLEMVEEDLRAVAFVEDMFSALRRADVERPAAAWDSFDSFDSFSHPNLLSFADRGFNRQGHISREQDLIAPRVDKMSKNTADIHPHVSPSLRVPELASISQDDSILGMGDDLCLDGNSWRAIYSAISGGGVDDDQSLCPDLSEVIEECIPIFSPEDEIKAFPPVALCSQDQDLVGEVDWPFGEEPCWGLPAGSELHQSLGTGFFDGYGGGGGGDTWFSGENLLSSSSPSEEMAESGAQSFIPSEFTGSFSKQDDLDRLLDSIVSEFLASDQSGGASPTSSFGQLNGSCLTHIKSEVDPPAADHPASRIFHPDPSLKSPATSPGESQSRSGSSMLLDEEQTKGPSSCERLKRRTVSPPFPHRPRPRDRQLIQDRIKELRELVPNASKCSIDSLLDRTIKLMQFLQSISNQGEKLRQYAQLKVKGKKRKSAEADAPPSGARWACDLVSEAEACPIVVENLDQPGHMLVEMLCDDYGLFLEIAQVIKHLDLTILRGVLETRSHELWAHFIVEGSRGFHRMDILWPLMQLLQRHRGPIASSF